MSDLNIQQIDDAPVGYSLTGKKIMVHDQSAPTATSTVLLSAGALTSLITESWTPDSGDDFIELAGEDGFTLVSTDQVSLVFVEGIQYKIVSGAPGNRQCQLDLANNRIYFQNQFDGTQEVTVQFKRIL